jgi:hypothetical protein
VRTPCWSFVVQPRQVLPSSEAASFDRVRLELTVTQAGLVEAASAGATKAVFGFSPQVRDTQGPKRGTQACMRDGRQSGAVTVCGLATANPWPRVAWRASETPPPLLAWSSAWPPAGGVVLL